MNNMTVEQYKPDELACADKEPYALQVLGNDMEPEFPDKCIIVIEHSELKQSGTYVVAKVEGSRWFRQYCCDEDGREYLKACNPFYPDIELNGLNWTIEGIIRQKNERRKVTKY